MVPAIAASFLDVESTMRRKTWARLLDPTQHIYSKAQPDPFAPTRNFRGKRTATPALHAEIRKRLLRGTAIRDTELARNFCVSELVVRRSIEYERGRIAGEREILVLWLHNQLRRPHKERPDNRVWQAYMKELVVEIARKTALFETDLLESTRQERNGPETHDGRSYGNLMTWAQKNRIIENTGGVIPSIQGTNHGRPVTIWRSLICETQLGKAA
jgi:hypothetical protein